MTIKELLENSPAKSVKIVGRQENETLVGSTHLFSVSMKPGVAAHCLGHCEVARVGTDPESHQLLVDILVPIEALP